MLLALTDRIMQRRSTQSRLELLQLRGLVASFSKRCLDAVHYPFAEPVGKCIQDAVRSDAALHSLLNIFHAVTSVTACARVRQVLRVHEHTSDAAVSVGDDIGDERQEAIAAQLVDQQLHRLMFHRPDGAGGGGGGGGIDL